MLFSFCIVALAALYSETRSSISSLLPSLILMYLLPRLVNLSLIIKNIYLLLFVNFLRSIRQLFQLLKRFLFYRWRALKNSHFLCCGEEVAMASMLLHFIGFVTVKRTLWLSLKTQMDSSSAVSPQSLGVHRDITKQTAKRFCSALLTQVTSRWS